MPFTETRRCRDRHLDHVDEVERAEERPLRATARDRPRDRPRVALLPVAPEDRGELLLVPGVDDRRGRHVPRGIHAHVERRVGGVREPSLGPVDLHRGDTDVEEDRVGLDVVRGELREDQREVAAEEAHVDPGAGLEAIEVRLRARVPIDGDELAAAREILGEQAGVPAGPEGGIDDRLARLHGEKLADLVREDGRVIRRAVRQDVRQHGRHSLRSLRGAPPRRSGPRSRGDRCSRSP